MDKRESRLRRARRGRARIRLGDRPRLTIFRTSRHIYAQVFTADGSVVLAAASTLEKSVRDAIDGATGNVDAAKAVGTEIAKRCAAKDIKEVAFDRAGFAYHGRVQALADAAREAGLEF